MPQGVYLGGVGAGRGGEGRGCLPFFFYLAKNTRITTRYLRFYESPNTVIRKTKTSKAVT